MPGRLAAVPLAAVALVGSLTLAGCARPVPWEHPTKPRDEWSTDLASCQDHARRLMRRELRDQDAFGDSSTTEHDRQMSAFDARKQELKLIENCMKDNGYRKVRPKGKDA